MSSDGPGVKHMQTKPFPYIHSSSASSKQIDPEAYSVCPRYTRPSDTAMHPESQRETSTHISMMRQIYMHRERRGGKKGVRETQTRREKKRHSETYRRAHMKRDHRKNVYRKTEQS